MLFTLALSLIVIHQRCRPRNAEAWRSNEWFCCCEETCSNCWYAFFSALSIGIYLLTICIGDGLRADLLFNMNAFSDIPGSPEIVAPYLGSIVEEHGAF